jgi:predicted HAD superfamily Cof-like phosphohydrolase
MPKRNFFTHHFKIKLIFILVASGNLSLFNMIKDTNSLNQVAEFHTTFKHPIVKQPAIPSKERCALRISLLAEELKELEQAVDDNNLIEVADALCDLQYVLSGAILEFGLGEKFKDLFDEVHRSNMSKACKSVDEATQTIEHYKNSDNTESYHKEIDGLYLVYRQADNKTLKSINYSPADLGRILGGRD